MLLDFKSVLLKYIPVLGLCGINLMLTYLPESKPTPDRLTAIYKLYSFKIDIRTSNIPLKNKRKNKLCYKTIQELTEKIEHFFK